MTEDQVRQDLEAAINERLAARREATRRRRERAERFAAEKKTRRDAGLRTRHERKLARLSNKEDDMAKEDALKEGAAQAFAEWLEMHPVTVGDVMEDAIKKAVKEWLDRHGPDLFGDNDQED